MKILLKKLLKKFNGLRIGVFIDSSNIYHAQKRSGWKVDYKKLKNFISKYGNLKIYNFYAAVPRKSDPAYAPTNKYLNAVRKIARLKTKPLKYIKEGNKIYKKGDVDLEIAIDVVRSIDNLDLVVVTSGDSDYLELKNWVTKDKNKKIVFAAFENNMAWEIRQCWHIYLNRIKDKIEVIIK